MRLPHTLIFIRHAIAVEATEFDGPDVDRPLIKKGIKKARKVFAKLAKQYRPTRIITSPYVRARETSQLLMEACAALGTTPLLHETAAIVPEGTWGPWADYLKGLASELQEHEIVVVIGHEPSIGQFFCRHIGFPEAIPFKKAGIGVIEPESLTKARLIAFAPAKFFK